MVSIVIRNKNEAKALENTLSILTKIYSEDIAEIILVDNRSTDDSVAIAEKFNCRIIYIDNFTYGRAINYGIEAAASKYILLLSSHSIPIGKHFFKNAVAAISASENYAGVRFINGIDNYNWAIRNGFKTKDPVNFGLLAACCIVNKQVWETYKFDETLLAVEDKEWSERVMKAGFEILDINETFFYFINRGHKAWLKKYKIETIASSLLYGKNFASKPRIIASFFKKILIGCTVKYFRSLTAEYQALKTNLEINKAINKKR
ncbi:glycosyltransferase family 2 protein [Flavobacterium pallidum]|uniref:Glycosyltransferase 2-like domain-containing protein n=1 Tax=Flavobacterium pallidum TaxID=2172098 RepID=A0A2S1SGX4_9FLAO|nr:glycosyltransferase [Flavobacterium pallidum]AWI25666.1 hypothetical protein HYN49_07005 [Flavobacterium pallidum]